MTKQRACEAKNPDTCRYHGTRIDASQWLPDYDAANYRLAALNTEVMGHVNRKRLPVLEAERQRAILDRNASETGMAVLDDEVARTANSTSVHHDDIFAQETRRTATLHRHTLLAEHAIADFEGLADDEYAPSTAARLFDGTGEMVMQNGNTTVVSVVNARSGKRDFAELDLRNPADRKQLVALRNAATKRAIAAEQYNINEVLALDHGDTHVTLGGDEMHAVISHRGVPYMRVEFNSDGTVKRGITDAGGGYNRFLDSTIPLRHHIADIEIGTKTPSPIADYLVA